MSTWKLIGDCLVEAGRLMKELGIAKLNTSKNSNKAMENNIEFKYIQMEVFSGEIIEGYRFRMQDPDYLVDIPMHIFNFIKNLDNKKEEKEDLEDIYDIQKIMVLWPEVSTLTTREIEVFKELLADRKRKDIAEILCVTENTVKKHTSHIFMKLDVTSRAEIINKINSKLQNNSI